MAVLWMFREPSLGRHARRELLRNAWVDLTPIIPAIACHKKNYVEKYSSSKNFRRERSLSVAALHGKAMMVFVRDRSGSRHRGPVESADGRGAHAVLPGDYGGPAGGGGRGCWG